MSREFFNEIIIVKTPLRISFAGGGTDLPEIYRKIGGGEVISTTIDKYIYVILKKRFDDQIRLGYSKTEIVDTVDEIRHDLIRESMRKVGITSGIEIVTIESCLQDEKIDELGPILHQGWILKKQMAKDVTNDLHPQKNSMLCGQGVELAVQTIEALREK